MLLNASNHCTTNEVLRMSKRELILNPGALPNRKRISANATPHNGLCYLDTVPTEKILVYSIIYTRKQAKEVKPENTSEEHLLSFLLATQYFKSVKFYSHSPAFKALVPTIPKNFLHLDRIINRTGSTSTARLSEKTASITSQQNIPN